MRFDWLYTFWTYQPGGGHALYHWLNLVEGCFWLMLAGLVFARCLKHRHSGWEVVYSASFVTFGLSDFREAYVVQVWLIAAKGVNLALLVWLRWIALRRFYPPDKHAF